MTHAMMHDLMMRIFNEIITLREDGQKEYARDEDNVFANFDRIAADLGISREKVLWVYVMKHRDGIAAYINGHTSQREDVRGRIKDHILYLILLWGMIDAQQDQHSWQTTVQLPTISATLSQTPSIAPWRERSTTPHE